MRNHIGSGARRLGESSARGALPSRDKEGQALGDKRYQALLDSVAKMMAKGANNDNEPPRAPKAEGV
jgi:hypothetical protein